VLAGGGTTIHENSPRAIAIGFLSHLIVTMRAMASAFIDHAIELVEKANAGLNLQNPRGRPVAPQVAKDIARDAFLSGVFFDGTDLHSFARWTRTIPIDVLIALELDGVRCTDCGNRFRTEFDHVEPHVAHGPASNGNLKPRCWRCHQAKTKRDRNAGRFRAPDR
jgi:5-methylcytosine-specific restriction endonuclease McrA